MWRDSTWLTFLLRHSSWLASVRSLSRSVMSRHRFWYSSTISCTLATSRGQLFITSRPSWSADLSTSPWLSSFLLRAYRHNKSIKFVEGLSVRLPYTIRHQNKVFLIGQNIGKQLYWVYTYRGVNENNTRLIIAIKPLTNKPCGDYSLHFPNGTLCP